MQRTFVVTGGTSGLGLALVDYLGSQPDVSRVIIGTRDEAGAERARRVVPPWRRTLLPLDLASLESVTAFAAAARAAAGDMPIDGLACVGGVQLASGDAWSAEGHELTFAVNHLAHHALVRHLLPALAPGAAVVLVGSGTHDPSDRGAALFGFRGGRYTSAAELAAGRAHRELTARQVARDRYATSKLCNLLCAYEWARRVPASQARFIVVDPGLMPGTGLARRHPAPLRWIWATVLPVVARAMPGASTPARSARVLAQALLSSPSDGATGRHLNHHGQDVPSSPDSYRRDLAADLFDGSEALISARPGHRGVA